MDSSHIFLLALLPAATAANFFFNVEDEADVLLLGVSTSVSTALVSTFSPPFFLLLFAAFGVILDGVVTGEPITEEGLVRRLESKRLSRFRSAPVVRLVKIETNELSSLQTKL